MNNIRKRLTNEPTIQRQTKIIFIRLHTSTEENRNEMCDSCCSFISTLHKTLHAHVGSGRIIIYRLLLEKTQQKYSRNRVLLVGADWLAGCCSKRTNYKAPISFLYITTDIRLSHSHYDIMPFICLCTTKPLQRKEQYLITGLR